MRQPTVLLLAALAGCGDDSGGPGAADLAPPPDLAARPVLSFDEGRVLFGGISQPRTGYPLVQPVAAGDFDGDGKLDLALPNGEGVSLAVALGDGALGFTALPAMPMKGRPSSLVSADFDGDGLDELVAGYDGNKLSLVHGRRNRIFDVPLDIDWIDNTFVLATGDFNGDGRTDVVSGPLGGGGLTLGLGDGKGGFTPRAAFPFAGQAVILSVGDLDGDKRDDVALSETFQYLDLLRSTGEALTLLRQLEVPGSTVDAAAIADFTGDGYADLLKSPSAGGGRLLLGAPGPTFRDGPALDLPGHAPAVVVGDVDGDGQLDVVMSRDREDRVLVLLGDGQGRFEKAAAPLATEGPAMGLSLRDFDGDGRLDIAVNQGMGGVRVFRNTTR